MGGKVPASKPRIEIIDTYWLIINQAEVYIALVKPGKSMAKTVSKVTGNARDDIYLVKFILERLGFVDKSIARRT